MLDQREQKGRGMFGLGTGGRKLDEWYIGLGQGAARDMWWLAFSEYSRNTDGWWQVGGHQVGEDERVHVKTEEWGSYTVEGPVRRERRLGCPGGFTTDVHKAVADYPRHSFLLG
jgi:hypothetical protein